MKRNFFLFLTLLVFLGLGREVFAQELPDASAKEKKYRIEFAFGMTRSNPQSIYVRDSGIEQLIGQYARFYNLTSSFTGAFKQSKLLIPFNLAFHYQLKKKLFLRAGIDYSFGKNSSNKLFQVAWPEFNESHDYLLKDRVSYIMPQVGIGYRFNSLALYGALGLGFVSFSHTETLHYSEPSYSHNIEETFKATSTAPGFIFGAKYQLPIPKKMADKSFRLFVKLEAVILKASTLKGSKTKIASNSIGENITQTITGTFYQYDWNPYGGQAIPYWDVCETLPAAASISNPKKMALNLSGIRLMLGFSF